MTCPRPLLNVRDRVSLPLCLTHPDRLPLQSDVKGQTTDIVLVSPFCILSSKSILSFGESLLEYQLRESRKLAPPVLCWIPNAFYCVWHVV